MSISMEYLIGEENIDTKIVEKKSIQKINKIPWVEKYRPKKLDEIMYQEEVKTMLKETYSSGNLPHLLFYGPPGTGKTSTILAVAMELYGPNKFKERVLELNASDERGIGIVRGKISMTAKTSIGGSDPNYPSPPFRIIILDEADAMTTEAQSALRKTIEDHSEITRFCFICNYIDQIIDPIMSRCVKFRFKPIPENSMGKRLRYIADNEGVNISTECLEKIMQISDGDFRTAITTLQNTMYIKDTITLTTICEIANIFPTNYLQKINNVCIISQTSTIYDIINLSKYIRRSGYPIQKVIRQIHNVILESPNLTEKSKSIILLNIADSEKKLIAGADEYIQILNILSTIHGVSNKIITTHLPIHLI